jgi:hypothetical protein
MIFREACAQRYFLAVQRSVEMLFDEVYCPVNAGYMDRIGARNFWARTFERPCLFG